MVPTTVPKVLVSVPPMTLLQMVFHAHVSKDLLVMVLNVLLLSMNARQVKQTVIQMHSVPMPTLVSAVFAMTVSMETASTVNRLMSMNVPILLKILVVQIIHRLVFKSLLETRALIGYRANCDILIGSERHLVTIILKTLISVSTVVEDLLVNVSLVSKTKMLILVLILMNALIPALATNNLRIVSN